MSNRKEDISGSILLAVFMVVFIGWRPIDGAFADMLYYSDAMKTHHFEELDIRWDNNFLFTPMMAFLSRHNMPERAPIVILAIINIGSLLWAARRLFPKDTLIAFTVFIGAYSFWGGAVNGLKAGCASSLLLCSLASINNFKVSVLFLFASFGFHHSMQIAVFAFIVCFVYGKPKIYYMIWFVCLLLSFFHVTFFQIFFSTVTDEAGTRYLTSSNEELGYGGRTGFRLDFIFYSAVPIIIGYYAIFKKKLKSKTYSFMLHVYMLMNSVWMLCMYMPYSNRIASLSWSIFPALILYPFLGAQWGPRQYQTAQKIAYGNVAFTFFMVMIYYVFIHVNR